MSRQAPTGSLVFITLLIVSAEFSPDVLKFRYENESVDGPKDSMPFTLTNHSGPVPVLFMRYMHRISSCILSPCHLDVRLA